MSTETIDLLVEGGNAKPGPTTAPKLGAYKINIGELFQKINNQTKDYKNMNVPVKIVIDKKTGNYEIKIGTPPVSSLLKKELGLKTFGSEKKEEASTEKPVEEKPGKKPVEEKPAEEKKERVIMGNLSIQQCIKVMRMKRNNLLGKDVRKALKEIVASCVSMPVTIEGKSPKEVLREINEGKYDDLLKE